MHSQPEPAKLPPSLTAAVVPSADAVPFRKFIHVGCRKFVVQYPKL